MSLDLAAIPLLDTHEHLRPETERIQTGGDALATLFAQYTATDLRTAGLAEQDLTYICDQEQPLTTRWRRLEPFWAATQHTAYARSIRITVRDLYDVPEIAANTIAALDERMRAASLPGLYQRIFERANIRLAIVQDTDAGALPIPADPPAFMRMVIKGGPLVWPRSRVELDQITAVLGRPPVHSLADWLDVCRAVFERATEAVAVKLAHAYVCSLAHSRPTQQAAEAVFNRIAGPRRALFGLDESLTWEECQPLRDFLVHHLIRLALQYKLPIQIHTGLLEGVFNDVRDAHPLHLIPLLLEYREARFVLFHGGYPWVHEFVALGKAFPNIWLDLCWLWIISPYAGRALLHELIETVPANKICAFGGDYLCVEGTYGHSVLARANIAQVLEEKVQEGWLTAVEALRYARAILHDNAVALYGLGEAALLSQNQINPV